MKNAISGSLPLILLTCVITISGPSRAVEDMHDHDSMQSMSHTVSTKQAHKAEGVVNSIDLQQGKINLTHGPVESLGWPGMTMDFKVKDNAILKGLHAGQKVAFEIVKEGSKKFYVRRISPLK